MIASALLLISCGPKLTDAHLAKIESGMTAHQVEEILGKPDDTHVEKALGFTSTTMTYRAKASEIKILLVNDKVISTSGQVGN